MQIKLLTILILSASFSAHAKPLNTPHNFEARKIAYNNRNMSAVTATYIYDKTVKACNSMKAYTGNKHNWDNCFKGMYSHFYGQEADRLAELDHDANMYNAWRY